MFDLIEKQNSIRIKSKNTTDPVTALYERLSRDDEQEGESNSITNHDLRCKGWFHRLIHIAAARLW